jgi:hypothetical protein
VSFALRRVLIPLSVAFAILVPALQSLMDLGLTASEFADDGNETLRAAGYAFSIWSVIYAGLVAYAIWQALPRNRLDPHLDRIAPAAAVAILGCGLWIGASALDLKWASVAIILVSAASLTVALRRAPPSDDLKHQIFAWWPLSLLAGWLTIASAINVLTVLTAVGALDGMERPAAFAGVLAVLAAALLVLRTTRLPVYGVPIAWGLVAVWVAERAAKPDVALLALAAAILVAGYAAWRAMPRRARS